MHQLEQVTEVLQIWETSPYFSFYTIFLHIRRAYHRLWSVLFFHLWYMVLANLARHLTPDAAVKRLLEVVINQIAV